MLNSQTLNPFYGTVCHFFYYLSPTRYIINSGLLISEVDKSGNVCARFLLCFFIGHVTLSILVMLMKHSSLHV